MVIKPISESGHNNEKRSTLVSKPQRNRAEGLVSVCGARFKCNERSLILKRIDMGAFFTEQI